MLKQIFLKDLQNKSKNIFSIKGLSKKFCIKENQKKTVPLLVEDPFMPYGCNLRYRSNEYLQKFHQISKDKQTNLIAFFHDKKKNKVSNYGVECTLNYYDASEEIVITSINADRRLKTLNSIPIPILPDENLESNLSYSFSEIKDAPDILKNLNFEVCKNIVSDINKVLYSFLEISSRQTSMDNPILREMHGNVSVMIQNLLKQNMDFIMEISKPEIRLSGFDFQEEKENKEELLTEKDKDKENNEQENFSSNMKKNSKKFDVKETYPEGMSRFNKLIFKTFQDFIKISKSFKKSSQVEDIDEILKCADPFLRTKLLIENIYNMGDYIIKELHIYDEYKKDSAQKHEKFFLRFAKKYIEQVAGTENFEDYKTKLDEWENKKLISEEVKRTIDLELKQAFSTAGNDMEMEDKKKTAIVEEIFSFPWDKRDKIEFDTKFTKEVFNSNLYGMENVKERIFEYVAKLKRTQKDNKKGFVILISGSPGVGKTTVAQLIGKALKRKTGLINLAGENDTIKLKGSRRTYVDSQPSKIYLVFNLFINLIRCVLQGIS
jgi:ATP-dependent Lon protease